MRELRALLVYITGAVCLVFGIMASGDWAFDKYHSLNPREMDTQTTGVASKAERADVGTDMAEAARRPIWIEPTRKYIYTPAQVVVVKPGPVPPATPVAPVTMPRSQAKAAAKPVRSRVAINSEARRAYGAGAQAQQLLILPLQHQAPN
jgi:hypothetical protein